jgi:hypothetical protein
MTVTCTNQECPENGVAKDATGLEDEAAAGEIYCGACGLAVTPDDA